MGANSTGQTPNQRLNDQVSSLLDNARRQTSQPIPARIEDLQNAQVAILTDKHILRYDQPTGMWVNDGIVGTVPFSLAGPLYTVTWPPYTPHFARYPISVTAELGTTGSSTTTVAMLRNGVSMGSISLGSGVRFVKDTTTFASFNFGADTDYIQPQLTVVGGGAADITIKVEFG